MNSLKIRLYRTRMIGGDQAKYEALVEIPRDRDRKLCSSIIHPHDLPMNRRCIRLVDALIPESHWDSEQGWDRYEEFLAWEKIADRVGVHLARDLDGELGHRIPRNLEKLPLWFTWPGVAIDSHVFTRKVDREVLLETAGIHLPVSVQDFHPTTQAT